jgi:CHAT domain-containing protein
MKTMRRKYLVAFSLILGVCLLLGIEVLHRQTARAMSVEEARKITAADKVPSYAPPPRTIDDIASVLIQHMPDAAKIAALKNKAESPLPPNLNGFAKAMFLAERGRAARDLGRTQQRLVDLRAAFEIAKPYAMKRGSVSVFDFPTKSNPSGSPAFQAYALARASARMGRTVTSLPPGKTFLDYMPTSPDEARARLRDRVSDESQHAVRIMQSLMAAEVDTGNFKNAVAIYEEVRPALMTVFIGPVLVGDIKLVSIKLRTGDVEGAKRNVLRAQQILNTYRQQPAWAWPLFNSMGAKVEQGLAEVALATGKVGEAETRFRRAIKLLEAAIKDLPNFVSQPPSVSEVEANIASLRLLLAQSLLRQGKLIESEVETRHALLDFLRLHGSEGPATAGNVLILADILQAQGRYRDAQKLAEIALEIYVRGGVEPVVHADALQRIAVGQASQGRWDEAMATFDKLKAAVANDESARKRYTDGNFDLAVALVRSGQGAAAIPIFENLIKKRIAEGGNNDYAVAEVRGFLGAALSSAGRHDEAFRTLHAAIPILIEASDATAKEEGAIDEANRRQIIVDSYFNLLVQIRGSELEKRLGVDAMNEAFRMADVAHAKSVQNAIAASSARGASGETALVELIRQAQDTDQQVAAISDLLKATLSVPPDQQDPKVIPSLRKDIEQLREARKTLRKEIERRFPQYAQLINPKPAGIAEARAKLQDGDALIVTYFSGGRGHVWAIPKQGSPAFAAMALSESEIVGLVDELTRALNSSAIMVSEIAPFNVAAAHKLYTAVIEPVAPGASNAKNIIVIPDGALGRLPFSLLVTRATPQPEEASDKLWFTGYRDVPFLIRDATVTQVPSVAAFATLRSVSAGSPNRKPFIGFGDPWFTIEQAAQAQQQQQQQQQQYVQVAAMDSPIVVRAAPKIEGMASAELAQLPRLSDTADEVREIARVLGADPVADVRLGADANEAAVRSMRLDDRRVVMFATHGLVPGELDGLTQPALALSSPAVPGADGDGLLTVEKILGLKLDADWVVLSACNTAAGEGGSAEAVSGLGRAFFYAGARALLVTHWPVETTSARALTTNLFQRQAASASLSRAAALREAMLNMIAEGQRADDTGRPLFAYAHPMFWAPFALVGDGANR